MDEGSSAIPLAQLRGFRIASGAPDMRLWHVYSGDGGRIGMVDELLVDPATLEVRYLDVEVENLLVTGRERHVLIPVAHARPDAEHSNTVVVDGLPAHAVARLPSYNRGTALRGADAGYVRPFVAERDAFSEPLDLPMRVEPPRVVRAIRMATPPDAPARQPAILAAASKEPAETLEALATATASTTTSRAA
ncbi:MAG TPA: PRC-barrel domain-containing protein [Longimicrobium sp.]|nr:PRC-barrel domain-containing protein [Longimicrobium sp.]